MALNYVPVEGRVFRIIDNGSTDAVTDPFAGLPNNAVITVNQIQVCVRYDGGSGNDVTLSVTSLPLSPSIDFPPMITTGNGDGKLDPDECNTLTLSSIIATLTTTTPGVVAEPASPYPDLAPGAVTSTSASITIRRIRPFFVPSRVQAGGSPGGSVGFSAKTHE